MDLNIRFRIGSDIIGRGDDRPILFIDLPNGDEFQTELTADEIVSSIPFLLKRYGVDVTSALAAEILRVDEEYRGNPYFAMPADVLAWAIKVDAPVNLLDAVRAPRHTTATTVNTVADFLCALVVASTSLDSVREGSDQLMAAE